MSLLVKLIVGGLLLLVFAQCNRKKTAAPNLQNWLDGHFLGRFQVLSTQADDAIRNLSFKTKKSVVAEAADTMVQSLVRWDARQPDLKLTAVGVAAQFERAAMEWKDAQLFYRTLKMNGFENVAVSVRDGEAVVLVFEEPTPVRRRERLFQLEKALADWPVSMNYTKKLAFMDTVGGVQDFGGFVPLTYWVQEDAAYRNQLLFSVTCKYNAPFSAAELEALWEFNLDSDRFTVFYKKVEEAVEKWAAENLKNKSTPDFGLVETEQSGLSPILLQFKIPAVEKQPEMNEATQPPSGYFLVDFDVDKQAILKISHADKTPEER